MISATRPRSRRPVQQVVETVHVPAPMGGLNTVSAGSDMPPGDCVALNNLVAAENGLRSRLGWREWCTTVGGAEVRTMLPYSGSVAAKDRLFATTAAGIFDVSASSAAPTQVVTFATSSADSGWGVAHALVTAAGHFLCYCDEENGYHLYKESTDTWEVVVSATQTAWAATTAYTLGQLRTNDSGKVYRVITAGTSAGSGGPTGTAADIVDGTVHWAFNQSVSGVDPTQLAHVMAWKHRLWFTQKGTALAWYLGLNSIGGAATSFNFGSQFRSGGFLVGLWNWTLDAGIGIDDYLVGISAGGDVVIYTGTDPTSATTFGLKGAWFVGGLPAGRHIATEHGGDLLILSAVGILPLSRVVSGTPLDDRSQYATQKVSNLFNLAAQTYRTVRGWAMCIHPQDNSLFVLMPTGAALATNQLVMALATKGWSQYQSLPVYSACAWGGKLYFGTVDGRVCINDGYVDGVTLASPTSSTPIQWSVLTAFQNLGTSRKKRVQLLRPIIQSQSSAPSVQAGARYDFDVGTLGPVSVSNVTSAGAWGTAVWGTSIWGGSYSTSQPVSGAYGMGANVALAVRGSANSRTVLVGVDVTFDQGGFL